MKTTIDSAGRVVVPKPMRDQLRLEPGQALEIELRDGRVEMEVAATPMKLLSRDGTIVAVPENQLPPLSAEQVRRTLEQTRR